MSLEFILSGFLTFICFLFYLFCVKFLHGLRIECLSLESVDVYCRSQIFHTCLPDFPISGQMQQKLIVRKMDFPN